MAAIHTTAGFVLWLALAGCDSTSSTHNAPPDPASAAANATAVTSSAATAGPARECTLRLKPLGFVKFSPDGRILLTGGEVTGDHKPPNDDKPTEDGSFDGWDLVKGERSFTLHVGSYSAGAGVFVEFVPGGKAAVASARPHGPSWPIAYWDLASGSTRFAGATIYYPEGIVVSHDGKLAVADGGGSNAVVLELPSLKVLHHTANDTAASGSMEFSADDASIVDFADGGVFLMAPRSLKTKKTWVVAGAALSPDGTALAIVGPDFSGIVDASSGRKLRAFESPPAAGDRSSWRGRLGYSLDGKRVEFADSRDSTRTEWDASTGEKIVVATDAPDRVSWTRDSTGVIAGPPSGRLLAGAGGTIIAVGNQRATELDGSNAEPSGRAWELPGGCQEEVCEGAAMSPDLRFLAYAREDVGTIRIVRLADGATLDLGVAWVGKDQRGFAIGEDGSFSGPDEAAPCAAKASGKPTKPSQAIIRVFFAK